MRTATRFQFSAMPRVVPALALLVVLALAPAPHAGAQSGWLEQGSRLWEKLTEGERGAGTLSVDEMAAGVREALRVGTDRVVARLGVADGFNADPLVHIPLPDSLRTVQSTLAAVGMSAVMDDLELRLNRAAESAAPRARRLFIDSIQEMTLGDVRRILEGPDDAATRYFEAKMSAPLAREMAPIVEDSLAEVGAIRAYDKAMAQYQAIPFVPDVKADLGRYVVEKAMDGIFYYLAREEAAIRRDPLKRSSKILEKVFGAAKD